MYLIGIAWIYVALMMAVVEATSTQGTVLGACFTFMLYGVLPVSIVLYVLGTPQRRRARLRAQQQEEHEVQELTAVQPASTQADGGDHPATEPLAPVRKEP